MIIKEISIQNFKSFGNNKQTINFDKNGQLILLEGVNGSGKCVNRKTSIDIDIKDIQLNEDFLYFLDKTETGNKIFLHIKENNPYLYEKIKKFKKNYIKNH